jgi:hypothetical protein
LLLGLVALGSGAGCKGCAKKSEQVSAIRFVSKDAQGVLQIADLGMLAKHKGDLEAALTGLVTSQQIAAIENEVKNTFGFDPATAEGLHEAGVPTEGEIAAEISADVSGALWIVPVVEPARFEKTLDRIVRVRATIDAVEKTKLAGRDATVMLTAFGPEKVSVAAWAFDSGFALIGAGPNARQLVERALSIAPGGDVRSNPEYAALDRVLDKTAEVRLIVPSVEKSAGGALSAVSRFGGPDLQSMLSLLPRAGGVTGAGWTVAFEKKGARIEGRVRFSVDALARLRTIFGPGTPPEDGVRAVELEDAVVFGYGSGDLLALLREVARPDTELRKQIDDAFARIKQDLGVDVEKDVLPLLSGHGAVALGVGNIAGANVQQLLHNPARYVWTLFALGATDPSKLQAIEKKMDPEIQKRGFGVSARKIGGDEIHVVSDPATSMVLVESTTKKGALILSNEPTVTDRALAATPPRLLPLAGKPGLLGEVRFGVLARRLADLNVSTLPVIYRAVVSKALQTLRLLDRASLQIGPAEDGLSISARIQLTGDASKK